MRAQRNTRPLGIVLYRIVGDYKRESTRSQVFMTGWLFPKSAVGTSVCNGLHTRQETKYGSKMDRQEYDRFFFYNLSLVSRLPSIRWSTSIVDGLASSAVKIAVRPNVIPLLLFFNTTTTTTCCCMVIVSNVSIIVVELSCHRELEFDLYVQDPRA